MRALFCYAGIGNQTSRVLSPKRFDIRFRHAAHFLKKSLLTRLFCVVKCRRITRGKSGYPIQNSRFLDSAHRDLSPGMFTSALRFVARADRALSPACLRPLYIFSRIDDDPAETRIFYFVWLCWCWSQINHNPPNPGRFTGNMLVSGPESNQICQPQALVGTSFCFRIRNRLNRP